MTRRTVRPWSMSASRPHRRVRPPPLEPRAVLRPLGLAEPLAAVLAGPVEDEELAPTVVDRPDVVEPLVRAGLPHTRSTTGRAWFSRAEVGFRRSCKPRRLWSARRSLPGASCRTARRSG